MNKDVKELALEQVKQNGGLISVVPKAVIEAPEDLSVVYTPGVAAVSAAIVEDKELVRELTMKKNTIAMVSDGSAVLGLGNIGPEASLPVMEGKSALFKRFGNIDTIPIVLATQDVEEIIQTVKAISPTFGAINLEDISAPRCFEIERRLNAECAIPVFHDDQHGTAIVALAATFNSLKLIGKSKEDIKVVINGGGAAGIAITRKFLAAGIQHILVVDKTGILNERESESLVSHHVEIAKVTNRQFISGTLPDALVDADIFIGVSQANVLQAEWIQQMAEKPVIFALANPIPEILPEEALAAGAYIVGTGRSDYPNQINNVLAFPGLFRGALDAQATKITEEMQIAAAVAIANLVPETELTPTNIMPKVFQQNVAEVVARAVIASV
ncbi:NAD(P)-dependent malic enzyme [Enterococcus saccharolyticus]|uniref:NAD(P)-dependent malic enzyme n=1 Tax=Enterococcus saccharolyticus TaxID=41997 RepID=UPI0039E090B3